MKILRSFTAFIFLLTSCVLDSDLTGGLWKSSDDFCINNYSSLVKKDGSDFIILQLADTHIGWWKDKAGEVPRTFDLIKEAVSDYKPDLLVLTGDNSVGSGFANMVWAHALITFLDGLETPYALVMGNHDGAGFFDSKNDNRQEAVAEIYESGIYSLFRKGPCNIYGQGNYGINITNEKGEIVYSLILLDSNKDYFRTNQIEWYKWYVAGINKSAYGSFAFHHEKVVKSLAFFHISLPEIKQAREKMKQENPEGEIEAFRQNPEPQNKNTGMFETMKQLGSTTHMFFGHDHPNSLVYEYQGIYFVYGMKTGRCNNFYDDNDRVGVTLITITDNKTVSVDLKIYDKY